MKISTHATLASLALASSLFLGGPAQAETVTMANWLPPSHPLMKDVLVPYAEDISKVTEGRVSVNVLPSPLGPPPIHFDLAVNGIADITYGCQGYTPGRFKTPSLAEVPFLGNSSESVSVAYWRVFDKTLRQAGEYDEVKVLGVFVHGPGQLFTKGRDLSDLANLSGAKLRIGGSVAPDVTTALGAVPVQSPSSKAYELLKGGIVDGILFPLESVAYFKLIDLLDQGVTVPGGLYNTSFFVVMNKAKWEALSDADKAAIDAISGEALARRAGKVWDAVDAKGRAAMEGKIAVRAATEAEVGSLTTLLEPVVAKHLANVSATGIDGAAALADLRAEVKAVEAGQ
ncbi:MAG: TRAP transporter substrate-binding protein [Rhodospirillum sp.]|nr:TRAP transporter substrate-binding protein [Rhodospirillum sp.]MCF8491062.1 TRAP transporter substrate-binding protein [Rhodospirillum sp.]